MRAVILFFFLAIMSGGACSKGTGYADPQSFWREFRQAVIADDKKAIAAMTHFPFEVRGPDDSDPVVRYNKQQFSSIYDRLINQSVYKMVGDQMTEQSMRLLIANHPVLTDADKLAKNTMRIEQFEFKLIGGKWKLFRAYLEE